MVRALIEGENIRFALNGNRIIDGIDLEIQSGELFGLIGPNGSGKTTLLRLLSGNYPLKFGQIKIGGEDISGFSAQQRARLISVVPQHPEAPPGFTVWETIISGRTPHLGRFGLETRKDRTIATDVLEQISLQNMAERTLETLSGGELQRVFLGRALCQQTPIMLLDEPTSNLDIGFKTEVLNIVSRIRAQSKITVLVAMHDLSIVGHYCDRIVLLNQGVVISTGLPNKVLCSSELSKIFNTETLVIPHPSDGSPVVLPKFGVID